MAKHTLAVALLVFLSVGFQVESPVSREVEIELTNGSHFPGEILALRDSSIVIATMTGLSQDDLEAHPKTVIVLTHAQVSSIKTAGESRTLTGLFWGMANGCVAGCLIGCWVSLGEAGEPWSRVMTGGMLGLLAGGLAGAVIGSVATGGLELISSTERDFTTLKIVTRYPDAEPEFLRAIAP